ncbi:MULTISPECIES: phage holin, lambda family [unclassified Serratia (in: enterobacteria)]|uniref:phage holin, lambda family n=1 Tax=unclassified Serratia (in: enterobacteria) TaxID=2647522 RepID=UPI00046A1485|nr:MULTISPECIES: phage holin, lambda family [unclassified Serratia (in: enterobacteria)]
MQMPSNPHNWADLNEVLASWWRGDVPIGGVVMAIVMAVLRMAYSGSGWKETILEGLMCGAVVLTIYSVLDFFDVPKALTVGIGGFIGFVGVKKLGAFLSGYVGNRFGGGNSNADK